MCATAGVSSGWTIQDWSTYCFGHGERTRLCQDFKHDGQRSFCGFISSEKPWCQRVTVSGTRGSVQPAFSRSGAATAPEHHRGTLELPQRREDRAARPLTVDMVPLFLKVYLSPDLEDFSEVPVSPETLCRDVVELCQEPGESGCFLLQSCGRYDRVVEEDENILELLLRGEARYTLRHTQTRVGRADHMTTSDHMTPHEQETAVDRDQEQRLRLEQETLRKLRAKAQIHEAKLQKIRAARGPTETRRSRRSKTDEVEQITALFQMKQLELVDAAETVQRLTNQLQSLRRTRLDGQLKARLQRELQIRTLNLERGSGPDRQRDSVLTEQRLNQLRQKLWSKKNQRHRENQGPLLSAGSRVAAVGPYLQALESGLRPPPRPAKPSPVSEVPPPLPARANHSEPNLNEVPPPVPLRTNHIAARRHWNKQDSNMAAAPPRPRKSGECSAFRSSTLPLPKHRAPPSAAVRPLTPDDTQAPPTAQAAPPQTVAAASILSLYTTGGRSKYEPGQGTLPRSRPKALCKPAGSASEAEFCFHGDPESVSVVTGEEGGASARATPPEETLVPLRTRRRPPAAAPALPEDHPGRAGGGGDKGGGGQAGGGQGGGGQRGGGQRGGGQGEAARGEAAKEEAEARRAQMKGASTREAARRSLCIGLEALMWRKNPSIRLRSLEEHVPGVGIEECFFAAIDANLNETLTPPPLPPRMPISDSALRYMQAPPPSESRLDRDSRDQIKTDLQTAQHLSPQVPRSILRDPDSDRTRAGLRVRFNPVSLLLDSALEGEFDLVQRVIYEVSDPSVANDEGITALHNAVCAGHADIVRFLVQFGVNVNAADSDGWTPLHCAASCNNTHICKFLVESGASVFAWTRSDSQTAADKCEEQEEGYAQCSQFLYGVQEKMGVMNRAQVFALWDFEAEEPDELHLREGDCVTVLSRDLDPDLDRDQGALWWWVRGAHGEGYVPRNLLGIYPRIKPRQRSLA
ncbi:hypothetical protein WMY93_006839 [Mugilogobius chulae]|uniref:SH3 domain-containing protein n=1 Tax=Mugilogobius chulae TaxID=88201 RepID=A0AAW0PWJ4_9GOBI